MKDTVEKLIHTVRHGEDAVVRREALIELGYEKDEAVYPVLIEQLADPNSSIQHAAVIALGRYGNPEGINELARPKILHSHVVHIRWAALSALGKLGDYRIIDHLMKAAEDSEWIVRNQAMTELKDKIQEVIQLNDLKYARIFVRMLALENQEIIDLVIEGFCDLGEKALVLLLDALKNPSTLVRQNAAKALGHISSPLAVIPLIELLQDPDWSVRRNVVEALGQIGDDRAIESLVSRLSDNVGSVQQQAMTSLSLYGRLATEPLLNALVHEKNKFSLRAILLTLGKIGDPKSISALINHLRSSYFVVRVAATRALIRMGSQAIESLIPTLSFNQSDIGLLLKDASHVDHPQLQLRAVKALGGLEDHRAVSLLKHLVNEDSPEIQDAAIQALGQIGCAAWGRCGALIVLSDIADESVMPQIIPSLKDDSDNVRLETVRALAKIDGASAIDLLIEVLKHDSDPYIRTEAARYLRRIGVGHARVLGVALSALRDSSRDVRSQAARLLGNFQDEGSIEPLIEAMTDSHWSVRESIEIGLVNFSERAVPKLIEALNNRSWRTRFRAARLLGEIGDTRAIEHLESLLAKKGERIKVKQVIRDSLDKLCQKVAA